MIDRETKELIEKIDRRTQNIEFALCGNKEFKIEGMIDKVNRHDKYIRKDEKLKYIIWGGISVLVFLFGLLTIFLK